MRRIYESEALHRDDDDPFAPSEAESSTRPQAMRWVNADALGRRLLPNWLRRWAISIDVATARSEYPAGASVPFTVTMRNRLPVPVTIPTRSPLLWTWRVDGATEASRVAIRDPPEESGEFSFDRGERKSFRKRWDQMFRVSETGWEPAEPGEYTIGAGLNVQSAGEKGLTGETTVRIVEE